MGASPGRPHEERRQKGRPNHNMNAPPHRFGHWPPREVVVRLPQGPKRQGFKDQKENGHKGQSYENAFEHENGGTMGRQRYPCTQGNVHFNIPILAKRRPLFLCKQPFQILQRGALGLGLENAVLDERQRTFGLKVRGCFAQPSVDPAEVMGSHKNTPST